MHEPMPSDPPQNPLQRLLEDAESDLSHRLRDACEAEARGVSSESAEEIRQLEDSLLAAAMAAERVVTARRYIEQDRRDEPDASPADAAPTRADRVSTPGAPRETPSEQTQPSEHSAVRLFEDETGRTWRAWPVTPDQTRATEATRRRLGDFHEGWICFEALDNSGRRRLPRHGRRWSDLPPEELPRLLGEAIHVPLRKTKH